MSAVDQAAPELLPCPWCGGPAAFRGAAIRCTSFACNASLSPVWTTAEIRKAKGDHAEKLRIAIVQTAERWNRRADLAAPSAPAEVARLTAELEAEKAKRGAQLEAAAQVADTCEMQNAWRTGDYHKGLSSGGQAIASAIRALDPDATTALDRIVKQAVDAETRACAELFGHPEAKMVRDRILARIDQRKEAGEC